MSRVERWSLGHASPSSALTALLLASGLIGAIGLVWPTLVAPPWLVVPFAIGWRLLPVGRLAVLGATVVGLAAATSWRSEGLVWTAAVALVSVVGLGLADVGSRGVGSPSSAAVGESTLRDLRERLRAQGQFPALPTGWHGEIVHRSANDTSLGGDFLVAVGSADGARLELALVDVSGNGVDAAPRALQLSGAFGGLLGAVTPPTFLSAANSYVLRQQWSEGFATAVHVCLDLETGAYVIFNAGHPPAAHFHAGSGEWEVVAARGPLLGVIEDVQFQAHEGALLAGDALLLYTDGLVESPDRELEVGIDRLLGNAERLVTGGFERGAVTLLDSVPTGASDDRACLLLWRT